MYPWLKPPCKVELQNHPYPHQDWLQREEETENCISLRASKRKQQKYLPRLMIPGSKNVVQKKFDITKKVMIAWTTVTL